MAFFYVADVVKRGVDDPFQYITRRRKSFNEANEVSQNRFRWFEDVFHDGEAHERFGMGDLLLKRLVGKAGEVDEGQLEVGQAGRELRGEVERLGKARRKCPWGTAVVEDHRDDRTRFSSLPQIPGEKG